MMRINDQLDRQQAVSIAQINVSLWHGSNDVVLMSCGEYAGYVSTRWWVRDNMWIFSFSHIKKLASDAVGQKYIFAMQIYICGSKKKSHFFLNIFDNKTIKNEDISPQVFVECMNQTRNRVGVLSVFCLPWLVCWSSSSVRGSLGQPWWGQISIEGFRSVWNTQNLNVWLGSGPNGFGQSDQTGY